MKITMNDIIASNNNKLIYSSEAKGTEIEIINHSKEINAYLLYALLRKVSVQYPQIARLTINAIEMNNNQYLVTLSEIDNLVISYNELPEDKQYATSSTFLTYYHQYQKMPLPHSPAEQQQQKRIIKVYNRILAIIKNAYPNAQAKQAISLFDVIHFKKNSVYFFYHIKNKKQQDGLITIKYDVKTKQYQRLTTLLISPIAILTALFNTNMNTKPYITAFNEIYTRNMLTLTIKEKTVLNDLITSFACLKFMILHANQPQKSPQLFKFFESLNKNKLLSSHVTLTALEVVSTATIDVNFKSSDGSTTALELTPNYYKSNIQNASETKMNNDEIRDLNNSVQCS